MMHVATIHVNPVEPAAIGFATAAGMPGDVRFNFRTQGDLPYAGIVDLHPQMVLRPFLTYSAHGYDIVIDDPTGASGVVAVPASAMNDRFHVEVYTRNADLQPTAMIASGRIDLNGYAYETAGPLAPMTYSVGPSGPMGATGPQGVRGSRWYTGVGAPTVLPDDRIEGDMYLDESTGDVWRWAGVVWGAFRGA